MWVNKSERAEKDLEVGISRNFKIIRFFGSQVHAK